MKVIEIKPLENGGHNNQESNSIKQPFEGWAVIPEGMDTPNFPFGDIEVEDINGTPTVTKWTAGVIPEPEPIQEPEPTADELLNALLGVTSYE